MLVGSILDGRYRILREIGKGGMGAVCEAVHLGTDRWVAVKAILNQELARNQQAVERFQREARAAGRIETQHIGQVLDTGVDGATGMPYLVMELLAGEDLGQLLSHAGPLAPDLALRIAAQACVGLAKAHEAEVVHRDIKPANLFLARRDRGEVVVKLLDFGVAKVKLDAGLGAAEGANDLTRTGHLLGSPLYMSPEQAKGLRSVDHRSDLWSLGITLYKALAGKTPFEHVETIGQLILAICTQPPPPIQDVAPWVPPEVAAVLHRALMPEVEARFQSAGAMLDALTRLVPDGGFIRTDMLRAAPAEMRAQVAPRFVPPPEPAGPASGALATAQTVSLSDVPGAATQLLDASSSSSVSSSSVGPRSTATPPASGPSVTSTAARSTPMYATSLSGAATESQGPAPRTSKLPFIGVALAAAVVGTTGAWLVLGRPTRGSVADAEHALKPSAAQASGSSRPSSSGGEPATTPGAPVPTPAGTTPPTPVATTTADPHQVAPAGGGSAPEPRASASASGDDPVSKLAELRRRFEAGKISRAAYDKERQKILDGM